MHDRREHGLGQLSTGGALQGGDGPGHRVRELLELCGAQQSGHPPNRELDQLRVAVVAAPSAGAQRGHDRPVGDEADRPHRHPTEPGDAAADRIVVVAAADGHEPAERVTDGERQRRRRTARRELHRRVARPARREHADRFETPLELLGARWLGPRTGGPHHQPTGGPGRLEADLAGGLQQRRIGAAVLAAEQPRQRGLQAVAFALEVGDDLLALGAADGTHRSEVLVGAVEQPLQGPTPGGPVVVEQGELIGGRLGSGRRCHGELEVVGHLVDRAARGCTGSVLHLLLGGSAGRHTTTRRCVRARPSAIRTGRRGLRLCTEPDRTRSCRAGRNVHPSPVAGTGTGPDGSLPTGPTRSQAYPTGAGNVVTWAAKAGNRASRNNTIFRRSARRPTASTSSGSIAPRSSVAGRCGSLECCWSPGSSGGC